MTLGLGKQATLIIFALFRQACLLSLLGLLCCLRLLDINDLLLPHILSNLFGLENIGVERQRFIFLLHRRGNDWYLYIPGRRSAPVPTTPLQ